MVDAFVHWEPAPIRGGAEVPRIAVIAAGVRISLSLTDASYLAEIIRSEVGRVLAGQSEGKEHG